MGELEDLELAYLDAPGGDARDALRRALAEAEEEIVALERCVSAGYGRPAAPPTTEPSGPNPALASPEPLPPQGHAR